MENSSGDNFSKSILDKFRLISQKSNNDEVPDSNSSANGKERKVRKRKHEKVENTDGLKESDVGIDQYISTLDGFSGIIKHRFSDFQVNEINSDGKVVELTSLEWPEEPLEEEMELESEDLITPEDLKKIEEIVECNEKNSETVLIDVTDKTKDERSDVHKALRKRFGKKIISNTKEVDGKKFIEIRKMLKSEGRNDWPRNRGSYLHCTLFKVNKDMSELVQLLSDKLRTKSNLIGFAGTKDKRAKTTQRISFKRRTAENVSSLKLYSGCIGNYSYQKYPICLGDNKGNRFRIAIRNVTASDEVIEANIKSLSENGFINYFGLQRFGSFSKVPTYAVGKALLASDWKLAVELILKPRPTLKGKKELFLAQQSWFKDRNAATAIRWIPKYDNSLEAKILRTLKTQGNNAYLNAIMALPRNTMTLYLHSYQSLIWNKVVSKRVEKFGLKPLVGDLVVVEEVEDTEKNADILEEEDPDHEENDDTDTTDNTQPTRKMKVREITEDELDSVSMSDVVYPLAGHDIAYPNNEIKQWYLDALAESNFSLEDLNNTHKNFALSGTYRRLLSKPSDMSWKIVSYTELDQDLILSDEDKLKNITLPECDNGQHRAVILSFNLDSCSYATMALREIIKCDTSASHHTKLTEEHSQSSEATNKKVKT